MQLTLDSILPYALLGGGLLIGYHLLKNQQPPELSNASNTIDYPGFPQVGIETVDPLDMDDQDIWPHPYNHPKIPRYVGAPAYFQNSIPMDEQFYTDDVWYDKNLPPLLVKVSQNQPTSETYSHHHFYFENNEPEPTPLANGIFKNIV